MDWSWAARMPTAPSDRSSRARTPPPPPLPVVRRTTTGQDSRCGTKGGKVSTMSMIAIRLPVSCAALLLIAAAPPDQGRVGFVIDGGTFRLASASASPGSTPPKPKRDRPNAGPKSRSAGPGRRARMLLDGRTVTIMRVGRSYNRTVARVTLAGRDVGSDWWRPASRAGCRAGSASPTGACAHADEDKGIAAPRPAPAGRGAADIQGISRSGGTAKSPAAKWARIAS